MDTNGAVGKGFRMAGEIFDVVDENDAVIGQAARREAHARGLRHRAVHVLVFNGAGRIILQKRARAKDTFPGAWDSSAAGHVAAGEDYDAAAARELAEELGWDAAEPPERLFKLNARAETGMEFVWVYRMRAEGPFVLQAGEIERGGWFEPTEVARWLAEKPGDFAGAFALIWDQLPRRKPG